MKTFYKNKKTKLWDEKVSPAGIVVGVEWEYGFVPHPVSVDSAEQTNKDSRLTIRFAHVY